MTKNDIYKLLDEKQDIFIEVSDKIWGDPELSLSEHNAAKLYERTLSELGFEVEHGVAGIETAFSGRFGSGKPVIGILGEYDALAGLSQKAGELLCCLTGQEIQEKAEAGKVSFGELYEEKRADLKQAQDNAIQCFEDGIYRIFLDDRPLEDLDEDISGQTDGMFTFVRLTMLSGRMW